MRKYLFLVPLLFLTMILKAQTIVPFAVNSSGGSAQIGGNTYDWSFAEMTVISTSAAPNLIVTAGLLQPIDPNVGIEDPAATPLQFSVYPNPATDIIHLDCNLPQDGRVEYKLFDLSGRQIKEDMFAGSQGAESHLLSMEQLAAGDYLLRIQYAPQHHGNLQVQTFKIHKIH